MTLPRFAGSALKRESCQSPTASKVSPTAQIATPIQSRRTRPTGGRSVIATWTGRETTQISAPCSQKTTNRLRSGQVSPWRRRISVQRRSSPLPRLRQGGGGGGRDATGGGG